MCDGLCGVFFYRFICLAPWFVFVGKEVVTLMCVVKANRQFTKMQLQHFVEKLWDIFVLVFVCEQIGDRKTVYGVCFDVSA